MRARAVPLLAAAALAAAGWGGEAAAQAANGPYVPGPYDYETTVDEMSRAMGRAYVRGIQRALAARGYDPGGVDGAEGPQTRAAIRAYQKDAGLRETGRASRELLDHIEFSGPARERAASVVEVQGLLAARGYYTTAVDGVAGPATRAALRRFQRDSGLPETGRADRETVDRLRSAAAERPLSTAEVQRLLAARGYYTGAVDGIAGPATRSAIRRFQRDAGLPVTGAADAGLSRALAN